MKIVADNKIPFLKGILEPFADVDYLPGNRINAASLINADALLTRSITQCNADLLENTAVKLIATATIGDDHIDKQYCLKNNIHWTTAKGCNANAVVQYVTAALLEIAGKSNTEIEGKTIGIIGVGEIGSKIANVTETLGLKILLNDPPRERDEGSAKFATLNEIQQNADIITLHVPLTFGGPDKTFHLLDFDFFSGLAKPVVLINTSRGTVLDTGVLERAIHEGKISKLILDVWENEPFINTELMELAEIATPHIAGYSLQGKANATAMVVRSICDFFHLNMPDWYPEIPAKSELIRMNCRKMSFQHVLIKLFKKVYPIRQDSDKLKHAPQEYERMRNNYAFRQENDSYLISFSGCETEIQQKIKALGFKVENI